MHIGKNGLHGYTGRVLSVDLTRKTSRIESTFDHLSLVCGRE